MQTTNSGSQVPCVAIIVSSFNRAALLRDALASLASLIRAPEVAFSIVVFDAGSTDGSIRIVESFRDSNLPGVVQVLVAADGEDSSFSAGLNHACAVAAAHGYFDYFFLFETDNLIDSVQPILRGIELMKRNPSVAATGYTVRKRNGRPAGFGERLPTILSFVLGQHVCAFLRLSDPGIVWVDEGAPTGRFGYCDVVYTSPLLIRAEAWRAVAGMDARTFPFSDSDLDLALRLRAAGWRCTVIEDVGVVHDNLGHLSEWSATRTMRFHAARFRLLRRHIGRIVFVAIPFLFARHLVEWCILSLRPGARSNGKLATRGKLLRGVWSGYE